MIPDLECLHQDLHGGRRWRYIRKRQHFQTLLHQYFIPNTSVYIRMQQGDTVVLFSCPMSCGKEKMPSNRPVAEVPKA